MDSFPPIVDCGVRCVDIMCQMTSARPVRVHALGARLTEEVAAYNYGMLQVAFDDGSVGWYEAGCDVRHRFQGPERSPHKRRKGAVMFDEMTIDDATNVVNILSDARSRDADEEIREFASAAKRLVRTAPSAW